MRLFRRGEGAAVATYAAVLDGVHLWLDLDGPVTLRDADDGSLTELGDHPRDLSRLTGTTYDVLAGTAPVRLGSVPDRPTARTPLTPDGTSRWEVVRLDDGHLRLVRHPVAPTAELDAVELRGDRLHLRVRPADGVEPGCHLLLLDIDDQALATLPATAHEGLVETLVGLDDLPAGYFGMLRLALGTDAGWVRIRRRADDLADAHHAVLLPELTVDDRPRARLRWNRDGLLALRSIDPDEAP